MKEYCVMQTGTEWIVLREIPDTQNVSPADSQMMQSDKHIPAGIP